MSLFPLAKALSLLKVGITREGKVVFNSYIFNEKVHIFHIQ